MFNLNLAEEEVVMILNALNELPRKFSATLFDKINTQAVQQKQAATASPAAATPEAPAAE
jgi:hypothetical protein